MSKFKVEDLVRKKDGGEFSSGNMVEEVGEWDFRWPQRKAICIKSTNTWIGEDSVMPAHTLTPGQTYTSKNGNKWECIFVRDGKAWLVGVYDGKAKGPAYDFDVDGTASWVRECDRAAYNIVFEPVREHHEAKVDTKHGPVWITYETLDGVINHDSLKFEHPF